MPQNLQNVSVTLKYRDQLGRNTSKITPWNFGQNKDKANKTCDLFI